MLERHKRPPGKLLNPQSNNQTTRLRGISETYKQNKKRGKRSYTCFSVLIGPKRVVSRNFNLDNRLDKLEECKQIRESAVRNWPDFSSFNARILSRMINYKLRSELHFRETGEM